MKFFEKILKTIELSGQTKRYFSEKIGMHETHFSNMLKGRKCPPPYDQCVKLIEVISEHVNLTQDEREEILRQAGEERIPDKEKPFISHMFSGTPINLEDLKVPANKVPFIPMSNIKTLYKTNSLQSSAERYMISQFAQSDVYATEVCCDSMLPKFKEGEIVFLRNKLISENNDFVLVFDNVTSSTYLRQYKDYGKFKAFCPLNQKYDETLFDEDRYKIMGTVIGKLTLMK